MEVLLKETSNSLVIFVVSGLDLVSDFFKASANPKATAQMERSELADLVPDVLARIPVKSLVRFKNVHKSWQSIITNPRFINKHVKYFNAAEDSIRCTLIVKRTRELLGKRTRTCKTRKRTMPATFDHEVLNRTTFTFLLAFGQHGDGANDVNLSRLDLPYSQNEVCNVHVLGPCNGLYCTYSYPICMFNPSLRQVKVVARSNVPAPLESRCQKRFAGFGYDPHTDDYKVILIWDLWRGEYADDEIEQMPCLTEIYSLKTNSWREVKSSIFEPIFIFGESYINSFVNGACHWYGCDDVGSLVLAFDMVTEVFRKIRRLPVRTSMEETTANVAVFKESLAMFVPSSEGRDNYFDIWVMEDYSNDNSWTLNLRIGPVVGCDRPLGFWNDQFIFENDNRRMVLYDPNTKKIKNLWFRGTKNSLQAMVYMESLVSLRRGDQLNETETSSLNLIPVPLV